VRTGTPDDLDDLLSWLLAEPGPAAVVLRTLIAAAAPTP
jgi:hypothetical protein